MNKFIYWMAVGNALSMVMNLSFYAWGSHSPSSLAIGIGNGFVMLLLAQTFAYNEQVNAEREGK